MKETRHHLIEGEINEEALRGFIAFCNENKGVHKVVFLDSNGGFELYALAMVRIINETPGEFTCVATNAIYSAALLLFFKAYWNREVLPGTCGLAHKGARNVGIASNGIAFDKIERFRLSELKRQDAEDFEYWKSLGFNEKELSEYKKGNDVMLSEKRLVELSNGKRI